MDFVYRYDVNGNPDTVTLDDGVAPVRDQFFDYTWDARDLLATKGETNPGVAQLLVSSHELSYDRDGHRSFEQAHVMDADNTGQTLSWTAR